MKLCSNMKYEAFDMGKFVFKQGDESNHKFYVILSGEVGILTNANYNGVYERDKQRYQNTMRSTIIGKKGLTLITQQESIVRANSSDDEEILKTPSSGRSSSFLKDSRKQTMMSAFGQSVGHLSTISKFREIPSRKSTMKKELSMAEVENDEEHKSESFKSMAARFGHLVRVLGQGAEFGDAGICDMWLIIY